MVFSGDKKDILIILFSGRAPSALTLERLRSMGFNETNPWSPFSAFTVTVPGYVIVYIHNFSEKHKI
jgi:gamma-glutamyltranspeptidase